jgi:hypothetical protein
VTASPRLPYRQVRELVERITACEETRPIAVEVREQLRGGGRGRVIRYGGVWSPIARRYVAPIPDGWRPSRYFKAGPNQYQVILDFIDALDNDGRVMRGEPIIQDILIHGGRRSGKSSAFAPCGALAMIRYPGSHGLIMGPRKSHGDRITGQIRRVMDPSMWSWDERAAILRLANTAEVRARNARNYNDEVGDSLRWMLIDEAALLPEAVYEKLSPSLFDQNGVCCMATSPRGHNWVYRKTMKSRSGFKGIRDHTFPLTDNVFLSDAALRRAIESAQVLSKGAYTEEILGEYIPDAGLAFGDFSDDNILDPIMMPDDVTEKLCNFMFNRKARYIAAVDFNFEPTIGCVVKFDSIGRPWICGEIVASSGATDVWGERLAQWLRAQPDTRDMDPTDACVIIADASGHYQGTGRNAGHEPATWGALQAQGWYIESPTGRLRKNPRREERLEIIRSLVYNVAGDRRLFVARDCALTCDMFRELPLKNGIPNKTSPHIHTYDGATYGIYRVWGTGDGESFFGAPLVRRIREDVA